MATTEERIVSTTLSSAPPGATKAGPDAGDAAPKKKGKRKLVVVLVLVLALGGGGWFFFLRGGGGPSEPKKPEKGAVLAVDAVSINLADGHYLKLGFALQLTKAAKEAPDPSQALAIAIDQFSGQSMAKLSKPEERRKAVETLTEAVEKAYEDEVMDLYPTTMVMQ
jgi:flagellar FliL protein